MKWFLPLLLAALGASALGAHPFDDRADMVAEIILTKDASGADEMLLQVQYRYESPFASYNEAFLQLDVNRDERITREELDARYRVLVADMQEAVQLRVRDMPGQIVPIYDNFAFVNLDDAEASVDSIEGMTVKNLRIGYFFEFGVKFPNVWGPGSHPVEFYMASDRITIEDPRGQLRAWDDRGDERRAITSVRYDRTPDRFQRLRFNWTTETQSAGVIEPAGTAPARGPTGREQLIETDKQRRDEGSTDAWITNAFKDLRSADADLWVWLVVLGGMFVLGGYHALQPGHGKTLVASYLIGTQGTKTDALFLGVVVTAAHTSGVLLLMGGAWAASEFWPGVLENPEQQLAEWITLAVGATIFLMGFTLVMKRAGGGHAHAHDIFGRHVHPEDAHDHTHAHDEKRPEDSDILEEVPHDHAHGHHHHHGHDHDHGHHHHGELDPGKMTRWEILRLGILGGVIPCPSAFVIGLIAFQQQWYFSGLIMLVVFSLGLAAVLATIGLVLVQTKSYLRTKRQQTKSRLYRFLEAKLPVFGALVITLIGTLMVTFALIRLGLVDTATFTV